MALFITSKEAREILEIFRRLSGGLIRPNLWSRAAFGYSLSLEAEPEQKYDSDGTEFQDRTFFADDEEVLTALLRQRLGRPIHQGELGAAIKPHVERGLRLFYEEYKRQNKRFDSLILFLVSQCISMEQNSHINTEKLLPRSPKVESYEVKLKLGVDPENKHDIFFSINAPGNAPHVAIMGRNGTGKTRTGLSLLERIQASTQYPIPFLIFDYAKGDIATNESFAETIDANVIHLPDETIPFAPLALQTRDPNSIRLAARRFRDTIGSVVRLGAIQRDKCLNILERVYQDSRGSTPDLTDLLAIAEIEYKANEMKDDSLIACLREFADFPLFGDANDIGIEHNLFKKSHIIDLHRLPEDLRKMTSFLLLDRLYSEIMAMTDAPLDEKGFRLLRQIIVIDEAHHYLPCKQDTLQHMVREVRSKGVAIWLFSQSPDDFDQPGYNFAREMGLSIVFSCMLERPKMMEALLGSKIDPKILSQLPAGQAISRIPGSNSAVQMQAWKP